MATDRIIVHAAVAPPFLKALKTSLATMASTMTEPPKVVTAASKARLDGLLASAIAAGATVAAGNYDLAQQHAVSDGTKSTTFAPTILQNVPEEQEIWNEEAFGPVAMCRLVESDDEAIRVANATGYGLCAAVFTRDLRKGLAMARRIEAG
jgi:acyl-CoA reductase-like NAD-dependent aldehyde dehydrogenase